MQCNAAKVDDPSQAGRVTNHDFLGGSPRGESKRHGAQPLWPFCWRTLLIERLALCSIHEAFKDERTVGDASQGCGGDGQIVANEFELRQACPFGEVEFFRVGHPYLATVDGQDFYALTFSHKHRLYRVVNRGSNIKKYSENKVLRVIAAVLLIANSGAAITSPRFEIRGQVLPHRVASVSLNAVASPFAVSALTSPDGRFRFKDLQPGAYTLSLATQ